MVELAKNVILSTAETDYRPVTFREGSEYPGDIPEWAARLMSADVLWSGGTAPFDPPSDDEEAATGGRARIIQAAFPISLDRLVQESSVGASVDVSAAGLSLDKGTSADGNAYATDSTTGDEQLFDRNPDFWAQVRIYPTTPGNQWEAYVACGARQYELGSLLTNERHFGFRFAYLDDNVRVYATNSNDTALTETLIEGLNPEGPTTMFYAKKSETDIKFFVNGELVATHTTNLPSGLSWNGGFVYAGIFGLVGTDTQIVNVLTAGVTYDATVGLPATEEPSEGGGGGGSDLPGAGDLPDVPAEQVGYPFLLRWSPGTEEWVADVLSIGDLIEVYLSGSPEPGATLAWNPDALGEGIGAFDLGPAVPAGGERLTFNCWFEHEGHGSPPSVNNPGFTLDKNQGLAFSKFGGTFGHAYCDYFGPTHPNFFDQNPSFYTLGYEYTNGFAADEPWEFWMCCGNTQVAESTDYAANHFGFLVRNNDGVEELYASNGNGTTATTTLIAGYSFADENVYYAKKSATDIKFYINGNLVATHTSNLPSGTNFFYGHFALSVMNPGHGGSIDIYQQGVIVTYDAIAS